MDLRSLAQVQAAKKELEFNMKKIEIVIHAGGKGSGRKKGSKNKPK